MELRQSNYGTAENREAGGFVNSAVNLFVFMQFLRIYLRIKRPSDRRAPLPTSHPGSIPDLFYFYNAIRQAAVGQNGL